MKNIPDKLHVLIEVQDREIYAPLMYIAYEDAVTKMEQLFKQALGINEITEEFLDESSGTYAFFNPEGGYAWANDIHGAHFDWKILLIKTADIQ